MKKGMYLLLLVLVLLNACKPTKKEPPAPEKAPSTTIESNAPINQVIGVASIEPLERLLPLYAENSGIITKIHISENQLAKEGDIIVELSHSTEDAQLEQVKSKFSAIQFQITATKANKESVEVRYRQAINNYNRNQNLYEGQAITKQVLDDSKSLMESLQKDVLSAEAAIRQQESRLNELQADLNYYSSLLNKKFIRAPKNGKVLNLDVRLGSNVTVNQSIGDFAPEGPLMAVTEVDELFAERIKLDMNAIIRPQGSTEEVNRGKIVYLSPYLKKKSLFSDRPDNLEDRRVREVRIQLNSEAGVLIGSRVECVINLK